MVGEPIGKPFGWVQLMRVEPDFDLWLDGQRLIGEVCAHGPGLSVVTDEHLRQLVLFALVYSCACIEASKLRTVCRGESVDRL